VAGLALAVQKQPGIDGGKEAQDEEEEEEDASEEMEMEGESGDEDVVDEGDDEAAAAATVEPKGQPKIEKHNLLAAVLALRLWRDGANLKP
jgi:hypothetical protein